MNLTDFQKKLAWGVGILSIVCLWIVFPMIFRALIEAYNFPKEFTDFGAFGDIYGSLNTLISSIALCAVAFTTYLQVTTLKESREANQTQIQESKNAIFANQFYSLLNYKLEKYKSLEFTCNDSKITEKDKKVDGLGTFQILTKYFWSEICDNPHIFLERNEESLRNHFMNMGIIFFKEPIMPLVSYFYIYKNLIELIKKSEISNKDKAFYISVLGNSMFLEEQTVLFWMGPIYPDIKKSLDNSYLFNQIPFEENLKNYGLKFHVKGTFAVSDWHKAFDEFSIEENPA